MTLEQFLLWLITGGGAVSLFSWICEQIPQFQVLAPKAKWWIQLIGSVVLACLAKVILNFVPAEVIAAIAPYFQIVAGIVTVFLTNQVYHKYLDPSRFNE